MAFIGVMLLLLIGAVNHEYASEMLTLTWEAKTFLVALFVISFLGDLQRMIRRD